MTLSSETVRTSYDGDDATVAFSTVFVFWDDSDVRVVHRDSSGTETVYVKGTNYTLTGGSGAVGTVTTKTGFTLATGEKLIVISDRANTQATTFATGGSFPSANAERAIDQIVRLVQQDAEELGRKVGFSETSSNSDVDLPDLVADELWQVNSAGTALQSVAFGSISSAELTTPVSLALGGTATDLSSPTAKDIIRIDSAGTGMEGRNLSETVADLFVKGADIASADPLVIGTDGHYFDVTGTTTFDEQTVAAGRLYMLQFDGALTMTDDADHDLGGSNITTVAGDRALFYATAAKTVQLIAYLKEGGNPAALIPTQAVQADIEAETNQNTYIPPDLLKNSPGVAKMWAYVARGAGTPSLSSPSYNMTSVTDDGASNTICTVATDFSTAVFVPISHHVGALTNVIAETHTLAVSAFDVHVFDTGAGEQDTEDFAAVAFGDHA